MSRNVTMAILARGELTAVVRPGQLMMVDEASVTRYLEQAAELATSR